MNISVQKKIEKDYHLMKKLISEFDPNQPQNIFKFTKGNFPFAYGNNIIYWEKVTEDLNINELVSLIKIIAMAENNIGSWGLGSPTPLRTLFYLLARRERLLIFPPQDVHIIKGMLNNFKNKPNSVTQSILDWLLLNTNNPYIPFGFKKIRTNSLSELETRVNFLIQEDLKKSKLAEEERNRAEMNLKIKQSNIEKDRLIKASRNKIRSLLANKLSGKDNNDRLLQILKDDAYNLYDYKEELLKILDSKPENLNPDLINDLLKKFKEPEKEKRVLNEIRKKFDKHLKSLKK